MNSFGTGAAIWIAFFVSVMAAPANHHTGNRWATACQALGNRCFLLPIDAIQLVLDKLLFENLRESPAGLSVFTTVFGHGCHGRIGHGLSGCQVNDG